MFTGIIQSVGKVTALEKRKGDLRITLDVAGLDLGDAQLGDSIAVNGVCLTAVAFTDTGFVADVSNETLECSTLGKLTLGSPVNLEPALRLGDRLGGHWVSGHVDGVGQLLRSYADGRSTRYEFAAPAELAHYIAAKGSICIDGCSLTVNNVSASQFGVNIVPHTAEHTIISQYQPGQSVNLEVDIIARYLERLLTGQGKNDAVSSAPSGPELLAKLNDGGFL